MYNSLTLSIMIALENGCVGINVISATNKTKKQAYQWQNIPQYN
jgi:hypothetical protein